MIRTITVFFLIVLIAGCKTFIVKGSGVSWSEDEYYDYEKMTDRMCITNFTKDDDSSPCYNKSNTKEVTQYENGRVFVFPINKDFIENRFKSTKLTKELEGQFKYNPDDKQLKLVVGLIAYFSETAKAGLKNDERKKEKEYIKDSIESMFYIAYNRLNDNPEDSGVGIGIRPIIYTSPIESDSGSNFALAEVFFIDMEDTTIIGETIYGYVDFFNSGHGGFNIKIPTCYAKTSKRIDGCEFGSKEDIKKWVRKSQKSKEGYGEPVFEMSLASYLPPPDEPKAKGIPLDF